jgi:hypothetical protein
VLTRRPKSRHWHCKVDGQQETHLIVLNSTKPPSGRRRWTIRLRARKLVESGYTDRIAPESVRQTFKIMINYIILKLIYLIVLKYKVLMMDTRRVRRDIEGWRQEQFAVNLSVFDSQGTRVARLLTRLLSDGCTQLAAAKLGSV